MHLEPFSENGLTSQAMRFICQKYLVRGAAFAMIAALSTFSGPVIAAENLADAVAKANLQSVYASRTDLQRFFDENGVATVAMKQKGLASLEEWARKYGSQEYPDALGAYATAPMAIATTAPRALKERSAALMPARSTGAAFNFSKLTAKEVIVVDDGSRKILLSKNAQVPRSLASISKLMTALVSTDRGLSMNSTGTIVSEDEVGGARLRVTSGTPLTIREIFDSMLIGSANNAANAVARSTGLAKSDFVAAMNDRARAMGLTSTTFVDPSGIEVENISTATDVAALAFEAFDNPQVRRATTTSSFTLVAASQTHTVKNTDWLLTDAKNGLYVMGGKTGYLNESGWNFAVRIKDARQHPLLIVVMGASDQRESFNEASALAKWTWSNYKWTASKSKK